MKNCLNFNNNSMKIKYFKLSKNYYRKSNKMIKILKKGLVFHLLIIGNNFLRINSKKLMMIIIILIWKTLDILIQINFKIIIIKFNYTIRV